MYTKDTIYDTVTEVPVRTTMCVQDFLECENLTLVYCFSYILVYLILVIRLFFLRISIFYLFESTS